MLALDDIDWRASKKVAHTAAPMSSDTVSLPSFSNLARGDRTVLRHENHDTTRIYGEGYKHEHQTRRLVDFGAFMEKRKARKSRRSWVMEWATLPPNRHASWALRLSDVRGFAPCRQLRSENGGAARRHAARMEPRVANLCASR
ncbi:hypothetical protein [Bradyrhizobium sp. ORS 86]|uniref:hypothetical protein n=1 Tax=Bradyrhizobium sp. ORS 86 TaxID=1685970 RepID=UPI00388D6162